MRRGNRDDFSDSVRRKIGKRAGWLCSYPDCRRQTEGSNSAGDNEISIGVAAHICAAAAGGPRYDEAMTPAQRGSTENGIWLCQNHAKVVDSNDATYTVERLHEWKTRAQEESWNRVTRGGVPGIAAAGDLYKEELHSKLRTAADADLGVFRRTAKWPATAVPLMVEFGGGGDPVSTTQLARVLTAFDDLVVMADPGMGKTASVFQIAEAAIREDVVAIIVQLGEWSAGDKTLLDSVLTRPAFREVSEADLRTAAAQGGVVLLLDGWNELGGGVRGRATVEVADLRAEVPELGILVTTRRQTADVPINGTRGAVRRLDENQQLEIARALCGNAGEAIVERAWRTSGLRDLVGIPLYLNALLGLPEGVSFPRTKEEALRAFVEANEKDYLREIALADVTDGCHAEYLERLAISALGSGMATIEERDARKAVSQASATLVEEGQIASAPAPGRVLDTLVSHHVLVRVDEPPSYTFQHQQFEEWYASLFVERLMMGAVDDDGERATLQADVLNDRAWGEPVLFACERLGTGNDPDRRVCAGAILAGFDVDPMLAAEMIVRSGQGVWKRIRGAILPRVARWHAPGQVDRAVGFMVASGREEFQDAVWSLITHEDTQVRLGALRVGQEFSATVLGDDAIRRLQALSPESREMVLVELAYRCGGDGLDIVTAVGKAETDPKIRGMVAEGLTFSGAWHHAVEVLRDAEDETFDLLAEKGSIEDLTDGATRARLAAARARLYEGEAWPYRRVADLVFGAGGADTEVALETAVAEMEFEGDRRGAGGFVYEAARRCPDAVARGLLRRLRERRSLPHGAADMMAESNFALEDDALVDMVLNEGRGEERAEVAAAALGPLGAGRLVDRLLELRKRLRGSTGRRDEEVAERHSLLERRIRHVRMEHLAAAVALRSGEVTDGRLGTLADLIRHHGGGASGDGEPFGAGLRGTVAGFVEEWGQRLLDCGATRRELASIAAMASRAPSPSLLPILKRLLDQELATWRADREEAKDWAYVPGGATRETPTSWMSWYRSAFASIKCGETTQLMRQYLLDDEFGVDAAGVLAGQWRTENQPSEKKWGRQPDFSNVPRMRSAREADLGMSSVEGDVIFDAIEQVIGGRISDAEKRHAVALGICGAAVPHGRRDETIATLIELADHGSKGRLLNNLVLSGEVIDVAWVKAGISELVEISQKDYYVLREPWQLGAWLRLLPFTDRPAAALGIVRELPERLRGPRWLEEMFWAFRFARDEDAEAVLFGLAETDPRLCEHAAWSDAVFELDTQSAGKKFVELVALGMVDGGGRWPVVRYLATLIERHPELRAHVYGWLREAPDPGGTRLLAGAVAENPDEDGLWVLMELEAHSGIGVSRTTLEAVTTARVPVEDRNGTYTIVAVPAADLRRKLLGMVTDGDGTDAATRHLTEIDVIRDEYGAPEDEPRHPDLGSGKGWPITTGDLRASGLSGAREQ